MRNAWCVRADFGRYASAFRSGGYVAFGEKPNIDLSSITTREQLYPLYKEAFPDEKNNLVIGMQVGQFSRFLLDMAAGDVVVTPDANSEFLWLGVLPADADYFYAPGDQNCPFPHRRKVTWPDKPLLRSGLPVPLQNTLRSALAVFAIVPPDAILRAAGIHVPTGPHEGKAYDPYEAVLERILRQDDKEFEILVSHLLTALGFEGSEVTGKTGDGGVDATGELMVGNLAKVKVFVQAKRYKLGAKITANTVRQLRQAIPFGGQGAFITTADFQQNAHLAALEPGFPRIGLVNGRQLVDLLVEHWDDIPPEFQASLGLRRGLVLA